MKVNEKVREQNRIAVRKYRAANREKINARQRKSYHKSYKTNRETILDRNKKWQHDNADKVREGQRKYRANHTESVRKHSLVRTRRWAKANPEKRKMSCQRWWVTKGKERYANDPSYRLKFTCRNRVRDALNAVGVKKCSRTTKLIGCSIEYLRKHIESLWKVGMSWKNHGVRGWHIDHIRPCDSFDLSKKSEQKVCFHYSNLQPLWAIDNLTKGVKF